MKNKHSSKPSPADPILEGLAHHRAGRLESAAECYRQILLRNPDHPDALSLSGILARQNGDLERSEELIRRAIAKNSSVATYHHNLARTYALRGRQDQAILSFRRAIALNPGDLESSQMLAVLLDRTGDTAGAVETYKAAITIAPGDTDLRLMLADQFKRMGDRSSALQCLAETAEAFPGSFASHFDLANALLEGGKLVEAADSFRRALQLHPKDAATLNCLARVLHELGDSAAAKECYCAAIRLDPNLVGALSNFGALSIEMGELRTAEVLLRKAIQLDPDFVGAQSNLGCLLERQGQTLAAIECFRNVLTVDPKHVPTLCNLGLAMDGLGDEVGASACYKLALEIEPDLPLAHFNLSLHRLAAGDFEAGWRAYEQRWRTRQFQGKRKTFSQPQWKGEALSGRRLFLYAEQGLGDTLQFVRYVPMLAELGAEIVLEVQPELFQLLHNIHPSVQLIAKGDELPVSFDFHCPLMSLAGVISPDFHVMSALPYVKAAEREAEEWANRLESAPGLKVGIVWSGNPKHTRDRARSISLAQVDRLTCIPGVSFFSLQKGPAAEQLKDLAANRRPINLDPHLTDFTETAAAVANLDLVLTVDTSVAHLAGAMGKAVWILLPHPADWRWLKGRTDTSWYPSARLFRQSNAGDWEPVLDQVEQALRSLTEEALAHRTLQPHSAASFASLPAPMTVQPSL